MRASHRTTLLAIGIAAFFGLLEILRTQLTRAFDGDSGTSVFVLSHRVLMMWALLIVIAPWCGFMARRFPLRPGRMLRTFVAHVAGAALFVAMHLAVMLTYHAFVRGDYTLPSGFHLAHLYGFYAGMEVSVYAGIVGLIMMIDARREASERAVAAAQLAEHATQARLESLQAQIRPHFLFNTLNTLAVLARRGDGAAVDRAIGDLGELLRSSLDAGRRTEIPLGDELAFLDRYVRLQRLRFPGRLDVAFRIEPGAEHVLVPALLVQPLVENAIEHGLASADGGRVQVEARRRGEALEIEVTDDGPGFGAAPPPASIDGAGPAGLGLANTAERLALLYGGRGTLESSDRESGGARVTIRIPWRTAERA